MVYLSKEELVLRARSSFNGFAGRHVQGFWSTGVLECWKKLRPEDSTLRFFCITPLLQLTARTKERRLKPPRGAAQSQALWPGFFTFHLSVTQISPIDTRSGPSSSMLSGVGFPRYRFAAGGISASLQQVLGVCEKTNNM